MKAKVVVTIAIILGLITSVLVYTMLGTPQQQEPETQEQVSVVIAKDNIKERQKITSDMIKIKKVPARRAHFEALEAVENVQGRYTSAEIIAGEQILKTRLYAEQEVNSFLAFNLAPKERAVTIEVDEIIGVAGFLMPGDYVDVVSVFSGIDEPIVKTILQKIKVLAVAQDMTINSEIKPRVEKSITLAVNLKEAEKLVLAEREGRIRLALRSPKNEIKTGSSLLRLRKLLEEKNEIIEKREQSNRPKKQAHQKSLSKKKVKSEISQEDKAKLSKKVEVIRGRKKEYEDILIKVKGED